MSEKRRDAFAAMITGTTPGPWEVHAVVLPDGSRAWEIYRKEDLEILALVYSSAEDARVIAEAVSLLHQVIDG